MDRKCQKKYEAKGVVSLTHKITISINLNTENVDAIKINNVISYNLCSLRERNI